MTSRLNLLVLAVAAAAVAAVALPAADLPEPGDLALVLGEEEFEDYLDKWLEIEERKFVNSTVSARSGCQIRINGDLGQPQPVYLRGGRFMQPNGNSGIVTLSTGEQVVVACTGSGRTIQHPNIAASVATGTATCVNNALVTGAGWLNGNSAFGGLVCSAHAFHDAEGTAQTCFGGNLVIRVGFWVNNVFHTWYWSCFDTRRLEVLYVWYDQTPENAVHQTGVDRPSWLVSSPGVAVNTQYTQVTQKQTIASLVGAQLADKYVTSHQFLARGHLAAKSDFVFATGQRSSSTSSTPHLNGSRLTPATGTGLSRYNLRARIGAAGYRTIIYTGTFGVSQLRDASGRLVDIYLHRDANNNPQLPVPLYYYKVAYDASRRLGTAFVSINNPYYTEAEARALTFCTDRCRNNAAFNWLRWQPDRIDIGYSFCCTVDDFRRTVPHLPAFTVNGLLA
ncbi:hypothetical protein EVAR_2543_1 [Eumeta japonica]|uniref:DNA/RNA non-specific endonuclease/pyrophosphatase/phosphodiesterase domain-containing protein n=1 Tax=Eumeta variegata TaxID=151549 RepID=A0A4C1SPK7_EUMVA|nr:hypothetical protein EVAR_2543_1 [Eumeta japonica]